MIYKYLSKSLLVILLTLCTAVGTMGQLTLDMNMTPHQMVQNIVGNGVQISNVVVTACDSSYGYYYSQGTEMGTNEGLLLTTGKAQYAIGPNNKIGTCSSSGTPPFLPCSYFNNGCPGSPLLNATHDRTTRDATMFEFDIIPQGDSLKFKYTFASEEYNEWVGSPFNDVFGFFISGPNVGTDVNIALVPGSSQMVAINTVNATTNSQYWYNNSSPYGQFIQYDAFTLNLEAKVGNLIPCQTYHLKLVIADGTDYVYDSGVFINAIESNPVAVLTATSNGLDYMVEGCNSGTITFSRLEATPSPMEVTYWVGGTATNGVDYVPQLGSSIPNDPIVAIIPANETSVTINVDAVDDGIDEGLEYITIYLANPSCDGLQLLDSIQFFIHDEIDLAINPQNPTICAGQCLELTGSSTLGTLADFTWSAGVSDPDSLVVEVCPTVNTTYTLTASIGSCVNSDSVMVTVTNMTVMLTGEDVHCATGNTGSITSSVTNGVDPLTYAWTGPNGYTSSDANPTGLNPGQYCVTVTDSTGCSGSACITLIESDLLNAFATLSSYVCYPISCYGACDGGITLGITGGVQPYSFNWVGPNGFTSTDQDLSGLCAGTYTLEVTDSVGCVFTNSYILVEPAPLDIQIIGTVDLLCTGVETGEATVATTGGCAPYVYTWSHDTYLTGPNATDLASGTYTVGVTDQNGCTNGGSVSIVINDPINPVTALLDQISLYPGGYGVSCPGASDGFIHITTLGGVPPYTVQWVNASTGILFSSDEDLDNAPCGQYQMIVSDANNCTYSQYFIIQCVPAISVNYTTVPNACGLPQGGLGEIDVTVFGGHNAPYTYAWTGPDGFTSSDEDLTGLNSGDYILTVSDAEGCSTQVTIHIGQNDAFNVTSTVNDATCFNACDGSIDISITPADTYTYTWSGPNGFTSTSEDLTNLCSGNYTVLITSASCEDSYNFTIAEPQQITITTTSVDPICFGQNNGSIDAEVFGGSGDYTYQWLENNSCMPPFAGANTQDLSNLFGCDYTLVVTDNVTNCTATTTVTLTAVQVMTITAQTTVFDGGYNISCNGGNDGAITVTVTGGTPDCTLFDPFCYNYDWVNANCSTNNPADYGNPTNTNNVTNLPAGTYGVLVTDANGCLATTCVTLNEPDPIASAAVIDHIDCGETTGSITPNLSGGSGSYTSYQWTTGNIGTNAPNATTLNNLAAGNYTLVVTDSFGCEESFDYVINETPTATITVVSQVNNNCAGECNGSFEVQFTGGIAPYNVDVNGNTYVVNSDAETLTLNSLCAGEYIVVSLDQNNCEVQTTVNITEPTPMVLSLSAVVQEASQQYHLQCMGDDNGIIASAITGGVPGYTYQWMDADLNVISSNDTLFGAIAGTYCLQVEDGNGCLIQDCFEITEPSTALDASAVLSLYNGAYNISCYGATDGSIDVTVTGGVGSYTYDWDGNGAIDGQEDQTGLAAGEYALVIVDENFCQFPMLFNLTQPDPIDFDIQVSLYDGGYNIPCAGDCSGTIDLTVSGGNAPYTISWTGPNGFTSDTTNLTGLCAGIYTVTVVDANDCERVEDVLISEPQSLSVVINNSYDCVTSQANLCAAVTGGTGSYTYQWNNGETGNCITASTSGSYCVTVTDSNGCEEEVCYVVSITTPIIVSGIITNESCGLCNGEVNTTITASPGYTFTWDNNATTEDLTGLCHGNYAITVTDINNCSTIHTFTVGENQPITVNVTSTNVTCNGSNNGSIAVVITGATEPVTSTWQDPDGVVISNNYNVSDLSPGTYTFTWTDDAGCSGIEEVTITEPAVLDVDITTSIYGDFNISTVGGSDGSIAVVVSGGTPQYSYAWSHDQNVTNPSINGLPAGDYTIHITDANGCKLDTTITLIQPEQVRLYNGLTPNGDGFNDTYVIPGVLYCAQANFTVFNRWGNIVYEKSNYKNDWYGQSTDGGLLADGTYFVIFEGCDNLKLNTYVDLRRE